MTRLTKSLTAGLTAATVLVPLALATAPANAGATTSTNVPGCQSRQLKVTHGRSGGAAGTAYTPIVFTNTGATCTIEGVPSIQPVAGARHRRVGPVSRNNSIGEMPALHLLRAGQSVSTAFGAANTLNYPAARCGARRADGLLVTLNHYVVRRYVALSTMVCTKTASTSSQLIVNGRRGQ